MKYNHPFEIIESWLKRSHMTVQEKRTMKHALLEYATTHPVTSGLVSPYRFRYIMMALASFVLVLGGSIGMTTASMQSLPNEKLYPVKIWLEEFKANNQKTNEAIIAFETKRIETRFAEATRLAMNHELDDTTSQIVQSGLEHSRETIRNIANTVKETDPRLALIATNTLETTFSSNGKILATVEKNTGQNIGTIVLAAQVTTKKLALEKSKFEEIVALQPDAQNKTESLTKLALLKEKLPESPAVTDAQEKIDAGLYSDALIIIQKAEQLLEEEALTKKLEATLQVQVENPLEQTTPEISEENLTKTPSATIAE